MIDFVSADEGSQSLGGILMAMNSQCSVLKIETENEEFTLNS